MTHRRSLVLAGVLLMMWPRLALAYRPFNSTDAAIAARGALEIECGPVGYVVDADGRFLVMPSLILNVGVSQHWELVVEGRQFVRLQSGLPERRDTVRDTALSMKGILRSGSLQDDRGPSVGLEMSLLLPGIGTDPGMGASVVGIVSQRWSALTVHANGALIVTHEHTLGGSASGIVEGPSRWAIRPVAEVVVEQQGGQTVSGLVGAIWQLRDQLSLDAGWRVARTAGTTAREFRAGFTWAFPLAGHSGMGPPGQFGLPPRRPRG